jgi:cholesterol oxidase
LTITALSEYAMSQLPIFDRERARKVKQIRFSHPLPGQVSTLTEEGDLRAVVANNALIAKEEYVF